MRVTASLAEIKKMGTTRSRTWSIEVDTLPAGAAAWPARVSVPLPRGEGQPAGFAVRGPDRRLAPAQARTLVNWPDGSPRWVQLDFQARAAGPHTVVAEPGAAPVHLPIGVARNAAAFVVSVGRLQVTIEPQAAAPVSRVLWHGREVAGPGDFAFRVVEEDGGIFQTAARAAHDVKVEADGPQRFQLSWETEHRDEAGHRLLDVRFRVEFLAGVEGFTLSYQFLHRLPGRDVIRLQSIATDFRLPAFGDGQGVLVQKTHGLTGLPRVARIRHPVPILVDTTQGSPYVKSLADIEDAVSYPYFLSCVHGVGDVLALENGSAAVVMALHDLANLRPKTVTLQPGAIACELWPQRAGPLTLPQGRSAAHRFSFTFTEPGAPVDALLSAPAAYLEPATCWLDAADSVAAGATWDAPRLFTGDEPGAGIFDFMLREGTDRYRIAAGLFDYGDSPQAGYSMQYAVAGHVPRDAAAAPELRLAAAEPSTIPHPALTLTQSLTPVWANNEYDAIYALALESLRTRNPGLLRKLRAVARHQLEVDFVHYSDHWQHHRGTPCHTYDHTACSTAYPSHQWTQGLYYYYCLTGDDDVPEVVRAICDFNLAYLKRPEVRHQHTFSRELGWAVMAFVFGFELTGEVRYREAAAAAIRELMAIAGTPAEIDPDRPCAVPATATERNLGANFAVNTILMGVCAYHKATQEPWARALILRWTEIGFDAFSRRATGPKMEALFPESLAYFCELTGQTRPIQESLWHLVLMLHGYRNPWGGGHSYGWTYGGTLDAKMYAQLYRGLIIYLSACAKAGLLPQAERCLLGAGCGTVAAAKETKAQP